jgi:hypothetical protein
MPLNFRGLDVTNPQNRLDAGMSAMVANCRAYLSGGFALRNPLSSAIISSLPTPIHSVKRLNDGTPNGPSSGYALIIGASTNLYCWNSDIGLKLVATGLSGNPLSIVPFRPNSSPQPWAYVFDDAPYGSVTLITKYLISGAAVNFVSNGSMKVRSDGLIFKTGLKEPQLAPVVSTANSTIPFGSSVSATLLATTIPFNNYLGANNNYDFGQTDAYIGQPGGVGPFDGTAPFVVNVLNASTITITALSGSATVNGGTHAPTDTSTAWVVPANPGFPGQFIQVAGTGLTPSAASVVIGAFTDGDGNVIPKGVAPLFVPSVVDVGAAFAGSLTIQVPSGAVAFQIGINSTGNTYNANSGSYTLAGNVVTDALPPYLAILGTLNLYYWGDSPTSGAVGSYLWKNPGDAGSGISRSISDAIGNTSGNSFIFDTSFGSAASPTQPAGIPGLPGIGGGGEAMQWFQLSPESAVAGSTPVFSSPITTPYTTNKSYTNFNFCLFGQIYVPAPGLYTFVLTSKDDCIWGIQDAVLVSVVTSGTEASSTSLGLNGQTITVAQGYPLLPRQNFNDGSSGHYSQTTVVVRFAAAGTVGIEIDYDFWGTSNVSGDVERILLLQGSPTPNASPTIIPPLSASVRQETQYRYVYRSSATGAPSNPSPESTAESIPVTSNTITSLWSNDPQVDVVDYYRIDSATSDFTYVSTGPNDDLGGGGTNTPVSDSLTDTQLGTQILNYDNYEPFPVTDLPQKGIVNVSGGVITWVSGGAIGGTATGFNVRWLAGTEILIGSPTSLAYTFIARPTSNTSVTIPGVPDGTNLVYEIEEPILANQPLPYVWGPSDNIPFASACGDTINQGTMYWCAGNNLDAAPETNQLAISDPSESLVNGCYVGGKGMVATIKRIVAVLPNFFNALATATGTVGSTWSVRTTGITRGLFIPRCLCVSGGGIVYFRVDDGIHISPGGTESKSITDSSIYSIFSHEGSTPKSVTRNGITIYPPDDTKPELQKFSWNNGFAYFDYFGLDGNYHTLVFDEAAGGWIWDLYTPIVTVHAPDEGESTQGCLVGGADGTIRQFLSAGAGTEAVTGTVLTAAVGSVGFAHFFEVTVEYLASQVVSLTFIAADTGNGSYAPNALTLPATNGIITKYTTKVSPNKWRLLQLQFQSTDPNLQVFLEGCAISAKAWGDTGLYQSVNPFSGTSGGFGPQT